MYYTAVDCIQFTQILFRKTRGIMAQGELPPMKLNVVCWNIMHTSKPEDRKAVLQYYIDRVKRREEKFAPDLIFLQEVSWSDPATTQRDAAALLEGTNYWFTDTSWAKERDGCYNAILYNDSLADCDCGDGKGDDLKYSLTSYLAEAYSKIKVINRCGFENFFKGRVAIGAFCVRCNPPQPKLIAVSFHNTRSNPKEEVEFLILFLKELHRLTGYPILLAGDFNIDVTNSNKVNCAPFKPEKYELTDHRKSRIDNIMLWDDKEVFKLEPIKANKVKDFYLFNHDPLTTILQVKTKEEPPLLRGNAYTFSVFSWNIQGKESEKAVKHVLTALKNELKRKYDLVFLQEATKGLLDEYAKFTPEGYTYIYGVSAVPNHYNVIMYNKAEFALDGYNDEYYTRAKERLLLKLSCVVAFAHRETFSAEVNTLCKERRLMQDKIKSWARKISEDASFRHELQFLQQCCPPGLLDNLHTQFTWAILHRKPRPGSLIAVSLRITDRHSERMLTVILYLLKELRQCLPQPYVIPILLAGDFNMGVFRSDKEGTRICVYPLLPYNPQPYQPYEQSKHREQTYTDYIMLWDGSDVTWTLGEVHRYEICPKPFRDKETFPEFHHRPTHEILDAVSLHDPLTAELHHWPWKKPHKSEVNMYIHSMQKVYRSIFL